MIHKTTGSLLFLCVFITTLSAQTENSGALIQDEPGKHRVMIIPFNNYNYFSDADQELAMANDRDAAAISNMFRYGLSYNVSARVVSAYDAYNILTDTTVQSDRDLFMIYSSIHYEMQKPLTPGAKDADADHAINEPDLFGNGGAAPDMEKDKKNKLFKKEDEAEEEDDVVTSENTRYLNAVVTHPEIFANLKAAYGTDMFLFINQFELVTNYNHCLDRTANYFERKVIVHYSLYDAEGNQLAGEAVTVKFSSGETDIDDIIGLNFPLIANFLTGRIENSLQANAGK
ncbi:MAG: hypothetical protein R2794_02880 [Chitinophagales bacterium]